MLRHCNLPLNIFTDFRGHNMAKYTKQQAISIITDCAVKYKENLDDIGENEVMIHSSMADYKHNNYKDVEEELKKLGFTNIKT